MGMTADDHGEGAEESSSVSSCAMFTKVRDVPYYNDANVPSFLDHNLHIWRDKYLRNQLHSLPEEICFSNMMGTYSC